MGTVNAMNIHIENEAVLTDRAGTSAEAFVTLEHLHRDAGTVQTPGRGQPRKPAADDGDPRLLGQAATAIDGAAARALRRAGSRRMSQTFASGQSTKAATKPK